MSFVVTWLRADLRRRWHSLVVLTLLIALAAATVMAAVAGARRGASTISRLSAKTLPATAAVLPNTPGFDWAKVARLPEVEALTKFIVGDIFSYDGISDDADAFPPVDGAFGTTLEKPVLFAGRMYNPARDDEAIVTPTFVARYHKGVGDTVVLRLPSAEQLAAAANGTVPTKLLGPRIRMRIVGVALSPWALSGEGPGAPGAILMSPGVVTKYPAETLGDQHNPNSPDYVNALLRLRGGEAAVAQLRRDITRVTGRSDIDVWDLPDQYREAQRQITFEARCLLAFAAAVFVAGLFLVGQAIARYAAASSTELQTLRALGMTPRQAILTAASGPIIGGVLAALLATAMAYIASQWMPIGTAAAAESSRALSADWVVFGPGIAVVVALVAVAAGVAAWLALGAALRSPAHRRSATAAAAARLGLPVPVVVGTRFALEAGRGRNAVAVKPALIGAVAGVLGILAAFTFSHGVSDASKHPERFGQTYQVGAFMGYSNQELGPTNLVLTALHANPDVAGLDNARSAVATGAGGHASVTFYSYDSGRKALPVVISSGRMPTAADEVALAPRALSSLHTRVGARVVLDGNKQPHSYLVTGSALVPEGPHNEYSDGGWISPSGYDSLFTGFKFHFVFVTLAPSARAGGASALNASLAKENPALKAVSFQTPTAPTEILEIREVRLLPILLGAFLALLAVGAVGHALATAVRRRGHDLAVLRALGMTQWQSRWVTVTQATVVTVVGLVFGVPLGLALGRSVWRAVADYTPLAYVPPLAVWALALVGPAALLISTLLAAWPGQRAARLRIATILRAE